MKKIWLIFAQTVTVALGVWAVLSVVQPDWLSYRAPVVRAPAVPAPVASAPAVMAGKSPVGYSEAAKAAVPSVVNIYTAQSVRRPGRAINDPLFKHFFGERPGDAPRASSLGSGVIVSEDGYIVTNNHVIEGADQIEVALADGRTAEARVIGTDPDTDLAVIRIEATALPAIRFGDSDRLQVGDVVLAIGNPFGVGQTVTMGIVSALGRSELGINTFENFIQTDAPINPGNSGGGLVDASGTLVGINTAIFSRSGGSLGIGFAIPVSTVRQVMDAIIKDGAVTRGWLGVEVQDVTPELAASFRLPDSAGALIAGVVRGGPADRAGVRPGDVLTAIDGRSVKNASDMLNLTAALPPQKEVQMNFYRNGKLMPLAVMVGKRPKLER
ncbi:Do family serine endopeptidase [Chitinilyticum piscinae]|uniref:Do family serine endopeptidase n=1 Tax=Chitinilyticum piscinae TaxID=2866724 RepID=A0A8J7K2J2_9NEIS|nr:Do family serine endopeptidase [Chitinilyticum piscinae]MBE9610541.1 Do family serine endopeptidase [Chitinilyticum piscinae]